MKVNFDQQILNLKGEPVMTVAVGWRDALSFASNKISRGGTFADAIKELEDAEGVPTTLGDLCIEGLLNGPSAAKADGKSKLRRYKLAKAISKGGEVSLSTKKDCTFIDDCLADGLSALAYGSANAMLFPDDGDEEDPKAAEDAE